MSFSELSTQFVEHDYVQSMKTNIILANHKSNYVVIQQLMKKFQDFITNLIMPSPFEKMS